MIKESPPDTRETTVPVTSATRNNKLDDSTSVHVINEPSRQCDIPPTISPISSPAKLQEEEVQVMTCAPNQDEALSFYGDGNFLGPHPSKKKTSLHFFNKTFTT